jgi:hypothetical protein
MKFTLRKFPFLVAAFFCAGRLAYAQATDAIVEIPTTAHKSALIEIPTARQNVADANTDNSVTMAGEYKSTKNVIEQEKPVFWTWYSEFGYESEYNFRGTNLLPNSDGALFFDAEVSKWGFTLGFYDVYQLGTAHSPSWAIGESGGGGNAIHTSATNPFFGLNFDPETIQDFFNEIDLTQEYNHKFGPLDVTVGNIAFFIDRQARTFVDVSLPPILPPVRLGPFPTVENEQFDRLFLSLATSAIPHVRPSVTYYQTILNDGQDTQFFTVGGERNTELGGYLEGRLREFFTITDWLDFRAYQFVSYSLHDRTEPVQNPVTFRDFVRNKSLTGFDNAQVGIEFPIHLLHFVGYSNGSWAPPDVMLYFVPFGAYSYHISEPTAGTSRNEGWGGAKLSVTF